MKRQIQRAIAITKTLMVVYYAYMLEYRAELLLWVLSGSLPLILMGVWVQAAQGGGNFGLSPLDFTRYFLAVFLVRQFTVVWVIWEFEREVVEGKLSFRLLQPFDPGWHHFISHIAERFARLPFALILIVLFFWLYPQSFWVPSLANALLCLLVVCLAFVLRFAAQYTFAMFSFWIERANAIESFWFLFYLFLSGLIAPVRIFPPLVQEIVKWTPFPYMIDFPASILVGLPVNVGQGLAVMLVWIGLFLALNRRLWRLGLKRYSGMGA
ncbi:MAG: ABC-2 family transporter protein [Oculatellaceae cyanobacterium Prado106]|jgi:ABC-2 type transport system permease protein|nr:ABC-2 family transporter protein [Oculatellaceae cyanobacterium Prado106]